MYIVICSYLYAILFYILYLNFNINETILVVKRLIKVGNLSKLSTVIQKLSIIPNDSQTKVIQLHAQRSKDLFKSDNYILMDTAVSFSDSIKSGPASGLYDLNNELLIVAFPNSQSLFFTIGGDLKLNFYRPILDRFIFVSSGLYFTYLFLSQDFLWLFASFVLQSLFWNFIYKLFEDRKVMNIKKLILADS